MFTTSPFVRSPLSRQDDSRVTIIDIDERSLAAVGQWPWGRDVLARLVTRLLRWAPR